MTACTTGDTLGLKRTYTIGGLHGTERVKNIIKNKNDCVGVNT